MKMAILFTYFIEHYHYYIAIILLLLLATSRYFATRFRLMTPFSFLDT